jgi:hypothetical protein
MGYKKRLDTNSLVAQRDVKVEGALVDGHLDGVVVVDGDLAVEVEDAFGVGQGTSPTSLPRMRRGAQQEPGRRGVRALCAPAMQPL